MFKILIVEDDPEKLREIMQLLVSIDGIREELIDSEMDGFSARIRLKRTFYDLLVLDISIPPRKSQNIDPRGGISLLDEILLRKNFSTPTHVIGLTSHEEIFSEVRGKFEASLFSIVQYSQNSIDWQDRLRNGVSQWLSAKMANNESEPSYDFDVAIICALPAELQANLDNGWGWTKKIEKYDDTVYHSATINVSEKDAKIIGAHPPRMGMPALGALAMKMIIKYRPRYIIMTGIMAGVADRVFLGDLVVASPSWDWGSGKWITEEEAHDPSIKHSAFLLDPFQFSVDPFLLKHVTILNDHQFLYQLRKSYGNTAPTHDLNLRIGPVATGASVLSDKVTFDKIKDQHRKLLGIDMEAYALFSAVEAAPRPRPLPICIKSVVDYGDREKDDEVQDYGSYCSAVFTKELITSILGDRET